MTIVVQAIHFPHPLTVEYVEQVSGKKFNDNETLSDLIQNQEKEAVHD